MKLEDKLNKLGIGGAYKIYNDGPNGSYANDTIVDIVNKYTLYGEISDKAAGFVKSLLARIEEEKTHPATPVPAGKHTITGEVLTTKITEGFYGKTLKMLVKDDTGFKVWGSIPAVLGRPANGERVEFTANLEPSKNDPAFGFYKRPTKARLLTA